VLLDSGSEENYISRAAISEAGLRTTRKNRPYLITIADRSTKKIELETTIMLHITPHIQHRVKLDVFKKAAHDIILGLP
jgi:hypothetical protein